jgi:hypothetical protein
MCEVVEMKLGWELRLGSKSPVCFVQDMARQGRDFLRGSTENRPSVVGPSAHWATVEVPGAPADCNSLAFRVTDPGRHHC